MFSFLFLEATLSDRTSLPHLLSIDKELLGITRRNIFSDNLFSSDNYLEQSTPLRLQLDVEKERFDKATVEYLLAKTAMDTASTKKATTVAPKLPLGPDVVTPSTAAAILTIKVQLSPPPVSQPAPPETSPSQGKKRPRAEKEAPEDGSGSRKKTKEKAAPVVEARKGDGKKKKGVKKATGKTPLTRLAKKGKGVVRTDEQLREEAEACVASRTPSAIHHFTPH